MGGVEVAEMFLVTFTYRMFVTLYGFGLKS